MSVPRIILSWLINRVSVRNLSLLFVFRQERKRDGWDDFLEELERRDKEKAERNARRARSRSRSPYRKRSRSRSPHGRRRSPDSGRKSSRSPHKKTGDAQDVAEAKATPVRSGSPDKREGTPLESENNVEVTVVSKYENILHNSCCRAMHLVYCITV